MLSVLPGYQYHSVRVRRIRINIAGQPSAEPWRRELAWSTMTASKNPLQTPIPFFILSFHSEDVQLLVPKSADTSANRGLVRPNVLPRNIGYGIKPGIGDLGSWGLTVGLASTNKLSRIRTLRANLTSCEFRSKKSKSVSEGSRRASFRNLQSCGDTARAHPVPSTSPRLPGIPSRARPGLPA